MNRFHRNLDSGEEQRATALELFYDLVFVFALTQISHLLIEHLTWEGAGQAALVLMVAWWAWNYTTWATNELDPDSNSVRILIIGIMLASLTMAIAIPEAFGSYSLMFAASYVAIQVGRHAFLTFAASGRGTAERTRAGHILVWLSTAGVFWLAGGLTEGSTRLTLWLIALVIDYSGPIFFYWIPGRPNLAGSTWDVVTSHFAERFQLFVIIALGESIVITGATTARLDLDTARITAFAMAFLGTAALWWLYFDYVSRVSQLRLEKASENRTLLARDGFTYLHVVIIAGVILWAVGDGLVIAHPTETLSTAEIAAVVAGPAIYLLGHVLFRLRMAGTMSWRRLIGAGCCLLVGFIAPFVSALAVATLLVVVLVGVIASEKIMAARIHARGEPTPLDKLLNDLEHE